MNRMNDALGVEMTLVQLFETPTLAKLARAVERARDDFQRQPADIGVNTLCMANYVLSF